MPAKARDQIAALPLRLSKDGALEILLVTSRETKRWIIPKGWPMKGVKDHQAAAVEAKEEAGVKGRVLRQPVGSYAYWRRAEDHFQLCTVLVFALKVEKQLKSWKERGQRQTRWSNALEAAHLVAEPELSTLIVRSPLDKRVRKLLSGR